MVKPGVGKLYKYVNAMRQDALRARNEIACCKGRNLDVVLLELAYHLHLISYLEMFLSW